LLDEPSGRWRCLPRKPVERQRVRRLSASREVPGPGEQVVAAVPGAARAAAIIVVTPEQSALALLREMKWMCVSSARREQAALARDDLRAGPMMSRRPAARRGCRLAVRRSPVLEATSA